MSDMDARDIAIMRDVYGLNERGGRLSRSSDDYPVDGPDPVVCPECEEDMVCVRVMEWSGLGVHQCGDCGSEVVA